MSDSTTTWELAPAPEGTGHVSLQKDYDLFIGGKFVKSSGSKKFKSINPATEATVAEITESTPADVNKAVKAARAAYEGPWSKMTGGERGKYIYRIARMIQERAKELAVLE